MQRRVPRPLQFRRVCLVSHTLRSTSHTCTPTLVLYLTPTHAHTHLP